MRERGNRIEPQRQGTGKGNKIITFPTFQVGAVVGCTGASLTFKLYTENNTTETFTLKNGEKFSEHTLPFKKLEIIAASSDGWYYVTSEDLDAR